MRRRIARGQTYPIIVAQFSVMPQNAHEVDAYRGFWEARGAEVKVRPMLEWTATGTVRTDTIVHDSEFRIACPWGNNTMAIHQDGSVVACAVDYEGKFKVGQHQRHHRQGSLAAAWASSCASRTASIAGRTFPTSARAAATGRWPAPNTRRKESRVRGLSGTTTRKPRASLARGHSAPRNNRRQHQRSSTGAEQYGLRPEASEYPMMLVLSFVYPCNALCPHCPYTNSNIRKEYRDAPLHAGGSCSGRSPTNPAPIGAYLRISGGGEPMLHPQAHRVAGLCQEGRLQDRPDHERLVVRRRKLPSAARGRRGHDRVLGRCLRSRRPTTSSARGSNGTC